MASNVTPLSALGRGILAGAAGTAAMTAWQEVSAKLKSSDDNQQSTDDQEPKQDPWEHAPAPAKVGRRIAEGVFKREPSPELIPVFTHGMHWAYGTGWGAAFGLVAGSARATHALRRGLTFGAGVWAASYAQLVPMGLYEPPWKYPPRELALDLSYHLVYGAGVGVSYRVLARR